MPGFTFIDLFSGIGGFRLAFESGLSGRCVLSCEINPEARSTYAGNFNTRDHPFPSDAYGLKPEAVPGHDFLLAGFPCQPFSTAGRRRGLDDHRGGAFAAILRVLEAKAPKAFLLENVPGLLTMKHAGREIFPGMIADLTRLGYQVSWRVLDAQPFVPQRRRRVFIAGIRSPLAKFTLFDLRLPPAEKGPTLRAILEDFVPDEAYVREDQLRLMRAYNRRNAENGNNFRYRAHDDGDKFPTLMPRKDKTKAYIDRRRRYLTPDQLKMFGEYNARQEAEGRGYRFHPLGEDDKSPCLVGRQDRMKGYLEIRGDLGPRWPTIREGCRLMGFPDWFSIDCSSHKAFIQLGNAVVPPLVTAIGEYMLPRVVR